MGGQNQKTLHPDPRETGERMWESLGLELVTDANQALQTKILLALKSHTSSTGYSQVPKENRVYVNHSRESHINFDLDFS